MGNESDSKQEKQHKMTNRKKSTLDLDTILEEEIGQFGLYQFKSILLAAIVVVFSAQMASEFVFTAARISKRCHIPECESVENTEFSPPWILNTIPGSSITNFDNCQRFSNVSLTMNNSLGTCPAMIFDRNNTKPCEAYIYEDSNTVVYDFDLGCEEWRRSSIGTIRNLGTLIGLPLSGFISDRWGRKTALTISAFNTAWLGLARYWADSFTYFLVFEILESALGAGGLSCSYILVMELVGPKYRLAACCVMHTFFASGQIILGLMAWGAKSWRILTLAIYVPQLFTIFYFWMLSESVRWLMSKGHYEESAQVLQKNIIKNIYKNTTAIAITSELKSIKQAKKCGEISRRKSS